MAVLECSDSRPSYTSLGTFYQCTSSSLTNKYAIFIMYSGGTRHIFPSDCSRAMFNGCLGVREFISEDYRDHLDFSQVTNAKSMFKGYKGTLLDLGHYHSESGEYRGINPSILTNVSEMFADCTNLKTITVGLESDWARLPQFDPSIAGTSSQYANMFRNCTKLPTWDGVVDITRANSNRYFKFSRIWTANKALLKQDDTWNETEVWVKANGWRKFEVYT